MSRFFSTSLFFLVFAHNVIGQIDNIPRPEPLYYFNKFQSFNEKDADSSLHYLRLLAENMKSFSMVQDLFHITFARRFQKRLEKESKDLLEKNEFKKIENIGHKILDGMLSDSNKILVETAKPISFWTKILLNENNTIELIKLTKEFIDSELSDDIYNNREGRYALLIYQIISKKEPLKTISAVLLKTIITKLESGPININTDNASNFLLKKRSWYRYLYAYSKFTQANETLEKKDNKKAGDLFKTAYSYSPDLTDNHNSSAYYYEMFFLFGKEKRGFQDDYLNYLINNSSDKNQILATLLTMTLINPTHKEYLKSFYITQFPKQEIFNEYWLRNINKSGKPAPIISLKKTDRLLFSSEANKGKWILIDFWGTWCEPCRKEHPDLEKFYKTSSISYSNKIALITVACRNEEDEVVDYMTKFKYSFPVAMADNKIVTTFNIKSYPSKILITPQGKYILVPFGIDWVDFIKKYADL